eukprot:1157317-Pelagomonas_calceolata.AAC.2
MGSMMATQWQKQVEFLMCNIMLQNSKQGSRVRPGQLSKLWSRVAASSTTSFGRLGTSKVSGQPINESCRGAFVTPSIWVSTLGCLSAA